MSIRAVDLVLNSEVKPISDRFVLIVLANFANSFGISYPSTAKITQHARMDRKTVLRSLVRLRKSGVIEDTGKRTGRTKSVIVYRLPFAVEEPGEPLPKMGQLSSPVSIPSSPVSVPKLSQSTLENRQEPLREPYKVFQERISGIFHRRISTRWNDKELKIFRSILPIDSETLSMVERYYKTERGKEGNICRRDVFTFLNNYSSEVDRAVAWCKRHPVKNKIIAMRPETAQEETPEQVAERKKMLDREMDQLRQHFKKSHETG